MSLAARSRRARRAAIAAALGVAGAFVSGCDQPERPLDVLLITLDTTRRDHLSTYGYGRDTSPGLTRLAAEGVLFETAYSPTATTGPSHASLFTSLYPLTHGVVKNGLLLDERHLTLAEVLADNGYQTAAVVSSFVLSSRFGYSQGFAFYDDDFDWETSTFKARTWAGHEPEDGFDRTADRTTDRLLNWLTDEREPDRPWFLLAHYFDPHGPYQPPPEFVSPFAPSADEDPLAAAIRRYDGEISFTDAQLARLLDGLDRLGLTDSTLVAVTADHGEGLMDHGHMEHGIHLYEEAVRVPLILRLPGRLPAGVVVPEPIELLDLAPAILDLALPGLEHPDAYAGRSFVRDSALSDRLDPERPVLLFRRHYDGDGTPQTALGVKFGVRRGDWKYIEGPEEGTRELFDLATDPGETRNLVSIHPDRAAALSRLIERWRRDTGTADPETELDPEVRKRLEALGYIQ